MRPPQFLGLVCLFWAYVTTSNLLYAHGLSAGIAKVTQVELFAKADVRVLQHLMLLPVLLSSYWASMRIQWRPLWSALPLQVALGVAFASTAHPAMILAEILLDRTSLGDHMPAGVWSSWLDLLMPTLWFASFLNFMASYGFGLALVTGFALYSRFRDAELQVAALQHAWSSSRLATLRMQLSPHTLFNLLHTIRGQIGWDPVAAQAMVVKLAELLRRLLNAGERDNSTLADELQFVRLYLDLQQTRFADRLTVSHPDPATVPAVTVPSLILQPLAENAVVHGLAGHSGPVLIALTARVEAGRLILRIANTVAGRGTVAEPGIGLKNVRERLAVQFGDTARLSTSRGDTEWIAEISLPAGAASP
jgi:hypothetical protein